MPCTYYLTAKPLECGREAAALNKPNNESGSFAAAIKHKGERESAGR